MCWVGSRMAESMFALAPARCSAGEPTLGELGSLLCEREDKPLVNMLRRGLPGAAILNDVCVWGLVFSASSRFSSRPSGI
jgi:hypothetical protein